VTQEIDPSSTLQAALSEVMALLERQDLVRQLVARQTSPKQALVQSLVARQQEVELQKKLNRLHPADAAFVLESLPQERRLAVWRLVERERRGSILLELAGPVRAVLIAMLEDADLAALGEQLESEDFAELFDGLPAGRVEKVLAMLGSNERSELQSVLAFPAGSVGALMKRDTATLRADLTLADAVATLRKRRNLPVPLTSVFVVDANNVLQGVVPLDRLLLGDEGRRVSEVMVTDAPWFSTTESVDDAAQAFERYDLISAPVVNIHRQVVGRLSVESVLDRVTQDSFKQSLSQVGLSGDEDLFAPIWQSGRKRWAWLGINLLTAFVASRVVGAFEGSIAQLAALAALMPIVASIGGNTGNQTVALVIRGLALSQLNPGNLRFLVVKEVSVGALNGALWGLVMALITLLLYRSPGLAAVMAAAMVLNMVLAALVGVLCPVALQRAGRDPVMGSSILLTATTDSMGFLIFLGLATVVLL
jgi:magnesium transporter